MPIDEHGFKIKQSDWNSDSVVSKLSIRASALPLWLWSG